MEDLPFWRDMEAQFSEPADRAFDLHAMLVAPDLPTEAAEAGGDTIALMRDPSSSLDAVYLMGRKVMRVAVAHENWNPAGAWVITGGPKDFEERGALQARFESLAARAAVAAGVVAPDATLEEAVQAWLHLLKCRPSPHLVPDFGQKDWGMLNQLYRASALMCHELGTTAYQEEARRGPETTTSPGQCSRQQGGYCR